MGRTFGYVDRERADQGLATWSSGEKDQVSGVGRIRLAGAWLQTRRSFWGRKSSPPSATLRRSLHTWNTEPGAPRASLRSLRVPKGLRGLEKLTHRRCDISRAFCRVGAKVGK